MEKFIIEGRVEFNNHLLILTEPAITTQLTSNEADLLTMLLLGIATKPAVMKAIWESKGVIVTDSSYHQLIRALRQRLECHQIRGTLIKTLPRHGLRFLGDVLRIEVVLPRLADDLSTLRASLVPTPLTSPFPVPGKATPRFSSVARGSSALAAGRNAFSRFWTNRHVAVIFLIWTGVLVWQSQNQAKTLDFKFQEVANGATYHSTNALPHDLSLASFGIEVKAGDHLYEVPRGNSRWIAVCPASLNTSPESCQSFSISDASYIH